jgi:transcriptional regulator with XRE-family HTH domain
LYLRVGWYKKLRNSCGIGESKKSNCHSIYGTLTQYLMRFRYCFFKVASTFGVMAIHIGKKVKEELYAQGISVTVFAKKISRSRNVVYDIFERESIDTNLLNKIAKILNVDFFSLYSAQKEFTLDTIKHYNSGEPPAAYGKHAEEMAQLQQQNEALQKEVVYLKKIITLLESAKPKVKKGK